jgi:hypothetical protein
LIYSLCSLDIFLNGKPLRLLPSQNGSKKYINFNAPKLHNLKTAISIDLILLPLVVAVELAELLSRAIEAKAAGAPKQSSALPPIADSNAGELCDCLCCRVKSPAEQFKTGPRSCFNQHWF